MHGGLEVCTVSSQNEGPGSNPESFFEWSLYVLSVHVWVSPGTAASFQSPKTCFKLLIRCKYVCVTLQWTGKLDMVYSTFTLK